jgi:predicted MFS family arabinose efflux permease
LYRSLIDGRVSDATAQSDRTPWRTFGPVAALFVLSAAGGAYEIAPASVLPLIRASLQIGPAATGWLVSVMYATAVVASVPAGVVLERVPARRAVVGAGLALLVAGVGGWFAAVAGAYWWLVGSRVLGGVAYVIVWNAGASLAGQVVRPGLRATAVGVFTASAPVGFALGQFASPLVAGPFGWPAVLPAFGTLGMVGVAIFLLSTRGSAFEFESGSPDRTAFSALFRNRAMWTLSVLCFLAYSLYLFLNSWLPSYLTAELELSLALSGLLTALFPAVGVISRTSGGVFSDRLFGGRRRPVVLLSFGLATPVVAAFTVVDRLAVVVALVALAGFAVQLAMGLLFSYVTEVVEPEVRATAVSVLTSVGLFGAFLAPIAAGRVVDVAGYRPAFLLATVVSLVGVALAMRTPQVG